MYSVVVFEWSVKKWHCELSYHSLWKRQKLAYFPGTIGIVFRLQFPKKMLTSSFELEFCLENSDTLYHDSIQMTSELCRAASSNCRETVRAGSWLAFLSSWFHHFQLVLLCWTLGVSDWAATRRGSVSRTTKYIFVRVLIWGPEFYCEVILVESEVQVGLEIW